LFGEDRIDGLMNLLHSIQWVEKGKVVRWPADPVRDRLMIEQLERKHPELDLRAEIEKWAAWMLDHEQKKEVRPRARLTTWCSYDQRWGSGSAGNAQANGASQVRRGKGSGSSPRSTFGGAPIASGTVRITGFISWEGTGPTST
jgi:hypothetical protein